LSSGVVTLCILHTLESSRTITSAVEDDLGGWIAKGGLDAWQLFPNELDTMLLLQDSMEILNISRRVHCDSGECDTKLASFWYLGFWQDLELFLM
jgi:hypothetical protein